MKIHLLLFLFLTMCASPQFVGTPPDEPVTKLRIITTSPSLRVHMVDDHPVTITGRIFYVAPGKHSLSGSYNSGTQVSLENSTVTFEGSAGQSVLLCKAAIISYVQGKGKWLIIPVTGPGPVEIHSVQPGNQEPTCSLWGNVAEQEDTWVRDAISKGALKTFHNAKGQSILQFAKDLPSKHIVEILIEAGFD